MEFITAGSGLIIFTIIFFLFLLLPFLALISIVTNKFPDNDKLIWVVIVLLLPVLGAILYFSMGRRKRLKE